MRAKIIIILLIAMMVIPQWLSATVEDAEAIRIIEEAISRDKGFQNVKVDLEMILKNKEAQTSTRYMKTRSLEVESDGDKLLVIFNRPRDIKGTAFLTHTHKKGSDDQWLYLPALKRVKRISSSNKSGPFMGSEFAYEDLVSEEIEKYQAYAFLKEETCKSQSCYVIERKPVDKNSGYARHVIWIDKDHYRFIKMEYYDRKNELLKTRDYGDYQLFINRFWRPKIVNMTNHQSGKSTVLHFKNYQFQTNLKLKDFSKTALRKAR